MTTVEQQREQILVAPEAPVVTPVTTRDVLHRAADLLEEFGWTKGQYARTVGGVCCDPGDVCATNFCAAGAVSRALFDFGRGVGDGSEGLFYLAAEGFFGGERKAGTAWNDAPERTRAQVVAALREAAEASHE